MAINNRGDAEKLSTRPFPGAIIVVIAVLFLGAAVAYLVVPFEPAAAWSGVLSTLGF
jgi:hypothetical protein